jgi:hypothetical protein
MSNLSSSCSFSASSIETGSPEAARFKIDKDCEINQSANSSRNHNFDPVPCTKNRTKIYLAAQQNHPPTKNMTSMSDLDQ